jgi:chromosome segregation ATPase
VIYLIAKIFVYLLLALGLGVAAGWLWRNLQGAGRETASERAVTESRGRRAPSARRAQERLESVLAELRAREEQLAHQAQLLEVRDRTVAELERTCAEHKERLAAERARVEPAPAAADGDREELEGALTAAREELERLRRALAVETRQVEELSQERELQRRSLAALEQQLELAREGYARIASG